jgi:glycerol uptake facilitator-like aquaporin
MNGLTRKLIAEFGGTAALVCIVVGSGIMGTNLSNDAGIALLINAIATVLGLALLILVLGPVSGAHFNPAVTLVMFAQRAVELKAAIGYMVAQILGAIGGAILANVIFDLAAVQISQHARVSTGTLVAEAIATAGLIVVIQVFVARQNANHVAIAVAAWIGSAYFFTASTSFANPAVTIGRTFTDTFAGIAPASILPFIAAQLVGAAIGLAIAKALTDNKVD